MGIWDDLKAHLAPTKETPAPTEEALAKALGEMPQAQRWEIAGALLADAPMPETLPAATAGPTPPAVEPPPKVPVPAEAPETPKNLPSFTPKPDINPFAVYGGQVGQAMDGNATMNEHLALPTAQERIAAFDGLKAKLAAERKQTFGR